MQSKLSNTAYFYSILILSFPVLTAFIVRKLVLCCLVSLFVIIWGFFIEMNLRMATIKINKDTIEVKQLLGFGTKKTFKIDSIEGFTIREFRQRAQYHEYCYLIQDKKAVAVFSSLYYKNYMEVRNELQQRLTLLK